MTPSSQLKSKERVAMYGDVFTAERGVKAMCQLVGDKLTEVNEQAQKGQTPLVLDGVVPQQDKHEFIPLPIREYIPIDYRRLCEHGQ